MQAVRQESVADNLDSNFSQKPALAWFKDSYLYSLFNIPVINILLVQSAYLEISYLYKLLILSS